VELIEMLLILAAGSALLYGVVWILAAGFWVQTKIFRRTTSVDDFITWIVCIIYGLILFYIIYTS